MKTYKEEIQYRLEHSPKAFGNIMYTLRDNYNDIYTQVLLADGSNFSEKLYNFEYNNSKYPLCKVCNKTNTRFLSFATGYHETCIKNPCGLIYHKDSISAGHEKARQTNIERYGGVAPMASKEVQEKMKATNIERYGVAHALQNSDVQKKLIQTNIERYGVEHFMKDKAGVEKVQATNIIKYGGVSPMHDVSIKNKVLESRSINIDEITNKIAYTRKNNFINKTETQYNVTLIDRTSYIGVRDHKIKQTDYARYKYSCNVCNLIFDAMAQCPECPICHPKVRSQLENDMYIHLTTILPSVTIYRNKQIFKDARSVDFYFEFCGIKYAIEINGLYYHSESRGKDRNYHLSKTEECEYNDIRLIHIFEDELIFNLDIVKSKLNHILKLSSGKSLYARNCNIKQLTVQEARLFLETNHIQGYTNASIKYGAFINGNLVGVMTFNVGRYALGAKTVSDNEYELVRFATNRSVVGLGSKILKQFIKDYTPSKIISYADRRWTSKSSNVYTNIGFRYVCDTVPNYWYTKGQKRLHRINFAKHMLKDKLKTFDPEKTEYENMLANGYHRLWDCGHLKYEMTF